MVYGRRRIGKTRLILEWYARYHRGEPILYYMARPVSHELNLRMMLEKAASSLGLHYLRDVRVSSLSSLLRLVAGSTRIIVIDEITYWARVSPRVLSELQEFVDLHLPRSDLLLVLAGSLVGVMEGMVLSGGSPLYGRASGRIRLGELALEDTACFHPGLGPEDLVRLYALIGGIPFYHVLITPATSLERALRVLVASPRGILRDEKDLLLREELREPTVYATILQAIAWGHTTLSRISSVTGVSVNKLPKYLSKLESLGFVERRTPLFRKRGRYRIRDPVLRTWYRLLEPNAELLESSPEEALRLILERVDEHTAETWEDIVRRYLLRRMAPRGFTKAGFLEWKGEEIDVVLLDTRGRRAVVAEAKWSVLDARELDRVRSLLARKAYRLLPEDYSVEEALVAVRGVEGEEPDWVITPGKILGRGCPRG